LDERTYSALRVFKHRGSIYIFLPALVVALLVSVVISVVFAQTLGKSMSSGLNGLVAGSMNTPAALNDPQALAELQGDFGALLRLGQFAMISAKTDDGRLLATAGSEVVEPPGLDPREQVAVQSGKISAYVAKCACGNWEFMVVAPLTRAPGEKPYGVVRGHRAIGLVAPFILATVLVLVAVIMTGAAVANVLLRRLVARTEDALEEDQRIIDTLDRRLKSSLSELEEHSVGTLQALVAAVDARDTYTAHHSMNVSDYACAIAREMGLDDQVSRLERAGLLHDIGKIGIAESTLLKPGRLTAEEFAAIKEHSEIGAGIIEMAPFLADIVPVIRHHHERWDGTGYPSGFVGEQTPQLARILGVADALDAMTSDRAYRDALPLSKARRELIKGRGTQFDPEIVDAAIAVLDSRTLVIPVRRATRIA
jgi:putative nucleotidyltransferase with HDIG domain